MSQRLLVGIVIALASVVALATSSLTPSFAESQDAAAQDAAAQDAAAQEEDEEPAVTVLYTIHNEGYIEPCG